MITFDKVFRCLPVEIVKQINGLDSEFLRSIEEIRIYRGKPIQLISRDSRVTISHKIDGTAITMILNNLMKFSYYSYEEDMAKGFITIDGGHRVGICGKAVLNKGKVSIIRDVSSLNIRCSKEIIGCADKIFPLVLPDGGQIKNTLIVSPPNCGKTTMIRDLARLISLQGYKVGICDERSEIAGMVGGKTSYSFGKMVDVLDGCPKAEGMIMLIRSMSPEVIFTDEIGKAEDVDAIKTCINCGVRLITTIHGENLEDLKRSDIYEIIDKKLFNLIVFLSNNPKVGTIREVLHD